MMGDQVWEQDNRVNPTDPAKREWTWGRPGEQVCEHGIGHPVADGVLHACDGCCAPDPFEDDTPLVCGVEAGEVCEACD